MEYDRIYTIGKIGWITGMRWDEVDMYDDFNSTMITYLDALFWIKSNLGDMYGKDRILSLN